MENILIITLIKIKLKKYLNIWIYPKIKITSKNNTPWPGFEPESQE